MKSIKNWVLFFCFIIAGSSLSAFIIQDQMKEKKVTIKTDGKGFVVLELFTSEGCSSCPPADELIARLQQQTGVQPIYILAYHVDYWDHLGWKDVFGDPDFSKRQMQYSRWLSLSSVYTPQIIVNGRDEFVGSNEAAIRRAISEKLAAAPGGTLILQARSEKEKLIIQYRSAGVANGSHLLIAIIQKTAQSKVERGENAGHMLSHVQIVNKLQNETLSVTGKGTSVFILPKGFNTQNWEVVGMVQNPDSGEILAAAKAVLE